MRHDSVGAEHRSQSALARRRGTIKIVLETIDGHHVAVTVSQRFPIVLAGNRAQHFVKNENQQALFVLHIAQ